MPDRNDLPAPTEGLVLTQYVGGDDVAAALPPLRLPDDTDTNPAATPATTGLSPGRRRPSRATPSAQSDARR